MFAPLLQYSRIDSHLCVTPILLVCALLYEEALWCDTTAAIFRMVCLRLTGVRITVVGVRITVSHS